MFSSFNDPFFNDPFFNTTSPLLLTPFPRLMGNQGNQLTGNQSLSNPNTSFTNH